ncbi:cyclase family protein [Rhodococcus sp. NPDC057014]|uniref:cyclase family protein n=1 Tax=Rhodococcus sp. NPDC057014 TaxID=3346000 RepID=UPI00363BBC1A
MYSRQHPPTTDDVLGFFTKLSNWGRWGLDDQLGTLNLITPEARLRGIAAARHGISVSCAWDVATATDSTARDTEVQHFPPEEHRWGGVNEKVRYDCHDAAFTHLDAVSHIFWDGKFYNAREVVDVVDAEGGIKFGSVNVASAGLMTRGVLLDIPKARGVDWLELGEPIFPEDLAAAEERQNVVVQSGDAVLLRTGYDRMRRETDRRISGIDGQPGWHAACLPWLRERDVAYVGCDTGQDTLPSGYDTIPLPIHTVGQSAMGLWLIDHCDLYECAQTAERLQQWDFLLSAAPIRFEATSGSAVNPIATF